MGISGNELLKLKRGYTTGSCAVAATKAAGIMLLTGKPCEEVSLALKKSLTLTVPVLDIVRYENCVSCAVQKDSGDDPDITNKALIYARVELIAENSIEIDGGVGVGRVTKAGLDQEVGKAAINSAPRKSIECELLKLSEEYDYNGGFKVIISVPNGEDLASKTFNPRLGIVGGISILGTSGIVEPMSESAIIDSIKLEMNVLKCANLEIMLMTFGNYGENFAEHILEIPAGNSFQCSNFVGQTFEFAKELGVKKLLLVGHIGKLIKLAGGVMQTHSKYGDCRMEILTAHAAICGASTETCIAIMQAVMTDEALDLLDKEGLLISTMNSIIEKIKYYIDIKTAPNVLVEIVMFSNKLGVLGKSERANEFILDLRRTDK